MDKWRRKNTTQGHTTGWKKVRKSTNTVSFRLIYRYAERDPLDLGWTPWTNQRCQTSHRTQPLGYPPLTLCIILCWNRRKGLLEGINWMDFCPKGHRTSSNKEGVPDRSHSQEKKIPPCFCSYIHINPKTVRNSYPIPRMDEWIFFFGDPTVS